MGPSDQLVILPVPTAWSLLRLKVRTVWIQKNIKNFSLALLNLELNALSLPAVNRLYVKIFLSWLIMLSGRISKTLLM